MPKDEKSTTNPDVFMEAVARSLSILTTPAVERGTPVLVNAPGVDDFEGSEDWPVFRGVKRWAGRYRYVRDRSGRECYAPRIEPGLEVRLPLDDETKALVEQGYVEVEGDPLSKLRKRSPAGIAITSTAR